MKLKEGNVTDVVWLGTGKGINPLRAKYMENYKKYVLVVGKEISVKK